MKVMWTSTFAKKIGFKTAREKGFWKALNYLKKIGAIKIEQSGFRSDSNHHKKLVVIKRPDLVYNYLKISNLNIQNDIKKTKRKEDVEQEKDKIYDFVGFVEKVLMEIPKEILVDEIFVDRLYNFVLNEYYLQDRLELASPRAIAKSFLEETKREIKIEGRTLR